MVNFTYPIFSCGKSLFSTSAEIFSAVCEIIEKERDNLRNIHFTLSFIKPGDEGYATVTYSLPHDGKPVQKFNSQEVLRRGIMHPDCKGIVVEVGNDKVVCSLISDHVGEEEKKNFEKNIKLLDSSDFFMKFDYVTHLMGLFFPRKKLKVRSNEAGILEQIGETMESLGL